MSQADPGPGEVREERATTGFKDVTVSQKPQTHNVQSAPTLWGKEARKAEKRDPNTRGVH